jgi:hypothetical protein
VTSAKNDYTDVSDVGVDETKRELLYEAQTECCVLWTTKDGWPVGVMHRFVWHNGRFWVTCTAERKRVAAFRTRPKSAVIVTSEGTWLGGDVTTTAKTMALVHDDRATKDWFFPALAARLRRDDTAVVAAERDEFLRRLDTSSRVVVELAPAAWITYDGNRLEAALRGAPYDPAYGKASRNLSVPPDGQEVRAWPRGAAT